MASGIPNSLGIWMWKREISRCEQTRYQKESLPSHHHQNPILHKTDAPNPKNQSTRPHMKNTPIWQPNYTITPATASGLMEIEAARAVLAQVPLPVAVQAELHRRARGREQCLRSFSGLTASPQRMWQELSGYLTAWHACCSEDGSRTAGLRWRTHPGGHGLMFYRQVIGKLSAIHRKFIGNGRRVTATSAEADRSPANPVTDRNRRDQN